MCQSNQSTSTLGLNATQNTERNFETAEELVEEAVFVMTFISGCDSYLFSFFFQGKKVVCKKCSEMTNTAG